MKYIVCDQYLYYYFKTIYILQLTESLKLLLTVRSQAGARFIRTPRKYMFVTMTARIVETVIIIMLRQK